MIHTEQGKLTELIKMMEQDRLHVAEALGVGPTGIRSKDKTILVGSPREAKFLKRLEYQSDIINILKGML